MPIKRFKPTSAGQRFRAIVDYSELDKIKPLKSKTRILTKTSGRSGGKIAVRHKGGRQKRLYREIDFSRHRKEGVPAKVAYLEYDPNRTSFIARLHYVDGEKSYIVAPAGLKKGDTVMSGPKAPVSIGNALPLSLIPDGALIHNLELEPGRGGQIVRSAGQWATLMAKEGKYCQVKLPSGELRLFLPRCFATIGQISNPDHMLIKLGKASASRYRGIRPNVRGTAMPAGAHPHGGGEGRSGPGRNPRTVYGKPAAGKTRRRNKRSNKYILKRRK